MDFVGRLGFSGDGKTVDVTVPYYLSFFVGLVLFNHMCLPRPLGSHVWFLSTILQPGKSKS